MLPVSALKSMRVMFATPCYISGVSMNYVASIFSLATRRDYGFRAPGHTQPSLRRLRTLACAARAPDDESELGGLLRGLQRHPFVRLLNRRELVLDVA